MINLGTSSSKGSHLLVRQYLKKTSISERRNNILVACALIGIIALLHAIVIHYTEGWSLGASLWYTVTAGTTVGFGDYSPASPWGRLATVFLIYIPAIPIISYLMSQAINIFLERREQKNLGLMKVKMKQHIVILNFPKDNQQEYFQHFIAEFQRTNTDFNDTRIIIVSSLFPQGLPGFFHEYNVRLVSGSGAQANILEKCSLENASKIAILDEKAEKNTPFEIAYEIIHHYPQLKLHIIAETSDSNCNARLKSLGIKHILRPIRSYPELLARTIISPGIEEIINDLWDSQGEECLLLHKEYHQQSWMDICYDILSKDMGTPLGVITQDGDIRSDLQGSEIISVKAVFVIVPEACIFTFNQYNMRG